MKPSLRHKTILAAAALVGLLALRVGAQEDVEYDVYRGQFRGSELKIAGTSTVHDWEVETKLISGNLMLPKGYTLDIGLAEIPEFEEPAKAEVTITVRSIKSGKKRMDEVMWNAMKLVDFPKVTYAISELKPVNEERESGDPLGFASKGKLSVAGEEKEIEMPVTIKPLEEGGFVVHGEITLKMSDFGISPPAPKVALGLIKTGDEVDIAFDWAIAKIED